MTGIKGDRDRLGGTARSLLQPPGMNEQRRSHWQIKDTVSSSWENLPGLYTPGEIDGMRRQGCFIAARPAQLGEPAGEDKQPRLFYLMSEE